MMATLIDSLTIKNFRSLRNLTIGGFGQVNLITGKNNTGKSSVLEALRILASDGSAPELLNILNYREEDTGDDDGSQRNLSRSLTVLTSLFPGFPSLDHINSPIQIFTNGSGRHLNIKLSIEFFREEITDESRRLVPLQADLFSEPDTIPALTVESASGRRIHRIDMLRTFNPRYRRFEALREPHFPFMVLSPFQSEHTFGFANLWDKIVLTDMERDVVNALKIIDPEISAVTMVEQGTARSQRTAIVKTTAVARPVPLRSFGDGLNRLFAIILSLVNAKDGVLLIDEFENGLHHSIQSEVWRLIFKLAVLLNIQVFATSHSWDSIEAFQVAASEDPASGVLVRISRIGVDTFATTFTEDELAIVARDQIEVR